ncbi:hypothetical protein ACFRLW_28595, partial [Streptomyces sp. NPDC056728]
LLEDDAETSPSPAGHQILDDKTSESKHALTAGRCDVVTGGQSAFLTGSIEETELGAAREDADVQTRSARTRHRSREAP